MPLKTWKNWPQKSTQIFFQYCQPAQSQPKSQFLFHENFSRRDLCITTVVTTISFYNRATVVWEKGGHGFSIIQDERKIKFLSISFCNCTKNDTNLNLKNLAHPCTDIDFECFGFKKTNWKYVGSIQINFRMFSIFFYKRRFRCHKF